MTDETVKSIALKMQVSPEDLLESFSHIGLRKSLKDFVTKKEEEMLISYLQKKNKIVEKRLFFQKKIRSTLNILGVGGQSKKISIEVRKNHSVVRYNVKNKLNVENIDFPIQQKENEKIKRPINFISENFANNSLFINNKNVQKNTSYQKEIKNIRLNSESEKKKKMLSRMTFDSQKRNFWKCEENEVKSKKNLKFDSGKKFEPEKKECKDISYDVKNNNKVHDVKDICNLSNANDSQKSENLFLNRKKDTDFYQKVQHKNGKDKVVSIEKNQKNQKNIIVLQSFTLKELREKIEPAFWNKIEKSLHPKRLKKNVLNLELISKVEKIIHKKIIVSEKIHIQKNLIASEVFQKNEILKSKPPIVTIIGHVDHGKTSLLQCIRSLKTYQNEHGGITQRIGSYHVKTKNGVITFLDTPGHSAFSSMRNRGMQVADIAVLVVAADDGVMPQTVESIQNAKQFNIPIIVAINKIDKSNVDTERIKNELSSYGIISEEWGGENQFVYVSAKFKKGINSLLESILLQAEMLELKYSRNNSMIGTVIESYIDKGWGPVATILVHDGFLNKGDILLCGIEYGKVRAIRNEDGKNISSIGPSIPVEIFGLSGVPLAGEKVISVSSEKKAREMSLHKKNIIKEKKFQDRNEGINVENLFKDMSIKKNCSVLNLILKSDVQGLIEPIIDTIKKEIKKNTLTINIIGSGVGDITETDAMLSVASKSILIGFNVRIDSSAKKIIERENLNCFICYTIYQLIDNIKNILGKTIYFLKTKKRIGLAEVKNVFLSRKFGAIAGCIVTEGFISKNKKISLFREKRLLYEGKLESLRRFKDDVSEVKMGAECGVVIKNYGDYNIGDIIQVFEE